MKKFSSISIFIWSALHAGNAAAGETIMCNKNQTQCVIENKDFTIGDPIGVLNRKGEIVATGRIRAMRGPKRAFVVQKRHGLITGEDRIALLGEGEQGPDTASYKIYKEPAKYTVGVNLDYGIVSVASSTPGFTISPFATSRYRDGFEFAVRGLYASYSATMSSSDGLESKSLPYEMRQLGLLGGLGYRMLEANPVSFRGELSAGLANIAATVDGDPSLADNQFRSRAKVKNGWAPMGRWSFGAYYRLKQVITSVDFAQSLAYEALTSGISFGASFELK
jgi:hypothetical protein